MIVDILANKKRIVTASVSRTSTRKLKEFLINEHQRSLPKDESKLETYCLFFAGGEWNVPKEVMPQMYRAIISAYSVLTDRLEQEKKIISELLVEKPSRKTKEADRQT